MFVLNSSVAADLLAKCLRDGGLRRAQENHVSVVLDGAFGPFSETVKGATFSYARRWVDGTGSHIAPIVKVTVSFTEQEQTAIAAVCEAMRRIVKDAADEIVAQVVARRVMGKD
jgi:hypothetical protein